MSRWAMLAIGVLLFTMYAGTGSGNISLTGDLQSDLSLTGENVWINGSLSVTNGTTLQLTDCDIMILEADVTFNASTFILDGCNVTGLNGTIDGTDSEFSITDTDFLLPLFIILFDSELNVERSNVSRISLDGSEGWMNGSMIGIADDQNLLLTNGSSLFIDGCIIEISRNFDGLISTESHLSITDTVIECSEDIYSYYRGINGSFSFDNCTIKGGSSFMFLLRTMGTDQVIRDSWFRGGSYLFAENGTCNIMNSTFDSYYATYFDMVDLHVNGSTISNLGISRSDVNLISSRLGFLTSAQCNITYNGTCHVEIHDSQSDHVTITDTSMTLYSSWQSSGSSFIIENSTLKNGSYFIAGKDSKALFSISLHHGSIRIMNSSVIGLWYLSALSAECMIESSMFQDSSGGINFFGAHAGGLNVDGCTFINCTKTWIESWGNLSVKDSIFDRGVGHITIRDSGNFSPTFSISENTFRNWTETAVTSTDSEIDLANNTFTGHPSETVHQEFWTCTFQISGRNDDRYQIYDLDIDVYHENGTEYEYLGKSSSGENISLIVASRSILVNGTEISAPNMTAIARHRQQDIDTKSDPLHFSSHEGAFYHMWLNISLPDLSVKISDIDTVNKNDRFEIVVLLENNGDALATNVRLRLSGYIDEWKNLTNLPVDGSYLWTISTNADVTGNHYLKVTVESSQTEFDAVKGDNTDSISITIRKVTAHDADDDDPSGQMTFWLYLAWMVVIGVAAYIGYLRMMRKYHD